MQVDGLGTCPRVAEIPGHLFRSRMAANNPYHLCKLKNWYYMLRHLAVVDVIRTGRPAGRRAALISMNE